MTWLICITYITYITCITYITHHTHHTHHIQTEKHTDIQICVPAHTTYTCIRSDFGVVASGEPVRGRIATLLLYLNDVDEGGETEFLNQHLRIRPKCGRLVICPAFWTHFHRGNPPINGVKYMINGWMEFVDG